jgi:hypothetical protein
MRDHSAFAHAQEAHLLGMREYLLDPRNQLHRQEAERYIDDAFVKLINQLKAKANLDKEGNEAFCKLLEQIWTNKKAVMSLKVKDITPSQAGPAEFQEATKPDREEKAIERVQNRIISGTEAGLVALYETKEENKANIELSWKFLTTERQNCYDLQLRLIIRGIDSDEDKPLYDKLTVFHNPKDTPVPGFTVLNMCLDDAFDRLIGKFALMPLIPKDDE